MVKWCTNYVLGVTFNSERRFKNTFAPFVSNEELSVDAILKLLSLGLKYRNLPTEVQQAVEEEMGNRNARQRQLEELR